MAATVIAAVSVFAIIIAVVQVKKQQREFQLMRTLLKYEALIEKGASPEGVVSEARRDRAMDENSVPILVRWVESGVGSRLLLKAEYQLAQLFPGLISDPRLVCDHGILLMLGFEILETNAVSALPDLARLIKSEKTSDYVKFALVPLGETAWDVAASLARSNLPEHRRKAVYLIGALQARPVESVQFLKAMLDDADMQVRRDAQSALAEFPALTQSHFEQMLNGATNTATALDAAYGLYLGTNGLPALVRAYESTTNSWTRFAVLSVLAFKKDLHWIETSAENFRKWTYLNSRLEFESSATTISNSLKRGINQQVLWQLVRSNLTSGNEPRLRKEIFQRETLN